MRGKQAMSNDKVHPAGVSGNKALAADAGAKNQGSVTDLDRWLITRVISLAGNPRISITLWDGKELLFSDSTPVARVEICNRRTLYSLFLSLHAGFGDGYSAGTIKVHGNLYECMGEISQAVFRPGADDFRHTKLWSLLSRIRGISLSRAHENIHHHYDLGNDFYGLWLDQRMVYTCAYYEHPHVTLEAAQLAKMDHVCRKLELKPGETVVEAGCGWGSFALHMARHYGVRVKACNISHEQISYARQKANQEGLSDRVEFIEDDYRNISSKCDVFVSIGMLEHVGMKNYRKLGGVIQRCLKRSGRGLIHTIGRSQPRPLDAWIRKRIFPGGYAPSLAEMSEIFEPYRFSVLDVENLRPHYAKTCQAWLDNFEAVEDQVADMYSEEFVRAWRLYLAGSVASFQYGTMQLYQVLFAPAGNNDVPWTRHYQYQS